MYIIKQSFFKNRKIIWFLISLGVFTLLAGGEPARAVICSNSKGTVDDVNYDLTKDLIASNNQPGFTFDILKNAGSSINVNAICPSGVTVRRTYRSYVTPHEVAETVGEYQYIKLNDYLNAAISIQDSAAGLFYPPVNYKLMGGDDNVHEHKPFPVRDSNLDFHFKLTKPFVGDVNIPLRQLFTYTSPLLIPMP